MPSTLARLLTAAAVSLGLLLAAPAANATPGIELPDLNLPDDLVVVVCVHAKVDDIADAELKARVVAALSEHKTTFATVKLNCKVVKPKPTATVTATSTATTTTTSAGSFDVPPNAVDSVALPQGGVDTGA